MKLVGATTHQMIPAIEDKGVADNDPLMINKYLWTCLISSQKVYDISSA